jgi:putative flippase GtrA
VRLPRFLKAQAASLAGSTIDFLVTVACVEVLHNSYLLATVLGNAAGGLVNFELGRHQVFEADQQRAPTQGLRYFVVWLGSMLLNTVGVYLFTHLLRVNYLYSKVIVSLLVGIGFNYFLQLHFVFRKS